MKSEKEIERIEKKLENGKELKPEERCEGFYIENGKATDRALFGYGDDNSWNEDDEFVYGKYRKTHPNLFKDN